MKFPAAVQAIFGLASAILAAALVHEIFEALALHAYAAEYSYVPMQWIVLSTEVLTALGAFVIAAGGAGVRWLSALLLGAAARLEESSSESAKEPASESTSQPICQPTSKPRKSRRRSKA